MQSLPDLPCPVGMVVPRHQVSLVIARKSLPDPSGARRVRPGSATGLAWRRPKPARGEAERRASRSGRICRGSRTELSG